MRTGSRPKLAGIKQKCAFALITVKKGTFQRVQYALALRKQAKIFKKKWRIYFASPHNSQVKQKKIQWIIEWVPEICF